MIHPAGRERHMQAGMHEQGEKKIFLLKWRTRSLGHWESPMRKSRVERLKWKTRDMDGDRRVDTEGRVIIKSRDITTSSLTCHPV